MRARSQVQSMVLMSAFQNWHYYCFIGSMNYLLPLLVLLFISTSCSEEARLQNALDGIGEAEAFMSDAVGIAGTKPDVYKDYETVVELANPDQLYQMINDERPVVRIYGFQGMVETNHSETFAAFKQLLPDTTNLSTMSGCIMSSDRVNALATTLLTNDFLKREHYQLQGRERIVFDSLLLFSGHLPMHAWTSALKSIAPVPQHYGAIKKLAHDSAAITARIGLANFQREEDLDFLRSGFSLNEYHVSQAIETIAHFPHPSFSPFLADAQERILKSETYSYNTIELYLTIFQYTSEEIRPFLKVLDNYPDGATKKEHQQSAWVASQLSNDPTKQHLAKAVPLEEYQAANLAWLRSLAKYSSPN